MQRLRMVPVRRVTDQFEARVTAARLGAAGMVVQLRGGGIDGPYPFGPIEVLVTEDDLDDARELLLADDVESAFDDGEPGSRPSSLRAWSGFVVIGLLVLVVVARVLNFGS